MTTQNGDSTVRVLYAYVVILQDSGRGCRVWAAG